MQQLIDYRRDHELALIGLRHAPVNALGHRLRQALASACEVAANDPSVLAIIIHGQHLPFSAGADIAEFGTPLTWQTPALPQLLADLAQIDKPLVAAIDGVALGGGLELALACSHRIASADARLGLPEVLLGLLPGAGGTQRLPRLIGVAAALQLMLDGQPVDARRGRELGLIDRLADGGEDLLTQASRYTRELLAGPAPARPDPGPLQEPASDFFSTQEAQLAARKPGQLAPQLVLAAVRAACELPLAEGLVREQALFRQALESPQAGALRHAFFAEREAGKIPGIASDVSLRPINKVGIVGAGTMGGGIAMNFLNAGIPVVLLEVKPEALERGLGIIRKNYEATAGKGRMTLDQVEQRMALCRGALDYADLQECDLVIEAVFENMEIKKAVMAKLGEACKPGAIIATNTSTLDVDVLAAASGRPADVVGMHFFSPANVMRLLEVVRGRDTAPEVLATVMALAKKIRKVAVVSGVCFGFIGNRMLEPYLRECEFLLLEGATPTQIDRAIEAFGMAMGPCRMIDMAGADVAAKVVLERRKEGSLPADPGYRAACQMLFELGRHGQKTGAGYYRYEGRTPVHDAEVDRIMEGLAKQHGIARRSDISDEEIVQRCLYPLINEGAKILEEGIAYRAGDIDIVWLNGYGFPALKGGPMHAANVIGLEQIVACLNHYAGKRGNAFGYWTVAGLLGDLAAAERGFGNA